jgi:hypothetical protein
MHFALLLKLIAFLKLNVLIIGRFLSTESTYYQDISCECPSNLIATNSFPNPSGDAFQIVILLP